LRHRDFDARQHGAALVFYRPIDLSRRLREDHGATENQKQESWYNADTAFGLALHLFLLK
jgi:hypothetical protein